MVAEGDKSCTKDKGGGDCATAAPTPTAADSTAPARTCDRERMVQDSSRDMRRSVYERELKPKFSNQKLVEITHEDLRALSDAIMERGAPATAVHAREVVLQVFHWWSRPSGGRAATFPPTPRTSPHP